MSLGTSGTIFSYSQTPVIDPQGNIAAFCSSTGGWLPLICTMNCTTAMERMRELFDTDLGSLERNLSAADRGAGGIVTVPFFTGERTPDLPNGKACMFGLDSHNMRQENFLRSAIEGVTFGLRNGLKLLTAQDIPAEKIVLTGGGANSPTWRQMVADICNVPVDILTNAESAALGAALQALASISGTNLQSLTAAHLQTDTAACCEPQQDAVDFYQEHCRTYEHAAAHVEDIYR
jgi:xylulokinase